MTTFRDIRNFEVAKKLMTFSSVFKVVFQFNFWSKIFKALLLQGGDYSTFNFWLLWCAVYNIILTQKPICYEEDTRNILIQEWTKHSCIYLIDFCIVGE